MAKPFGDSKRPQFWLNLQLTQEFLAELSKARILALADLVQVKKGGTNPGTWFHEDVALEFARWLSPAFAIWCNDRIKEILLVCANGFQTDPHQKAIGFTEKEIFDAYWNGKKSRDFTENYYLVAILKAVKDFMNEEFRGFICTELRFKPKIEAAQKLFPEDRLKLRAYRQAV